MYIYSMDTLFRLLWDLIRSALSVEAVFPPQKHTGDGSSRAKSDARNSIPSKDPNEAQHAVGHPERRQHD